MFLAYHSFIEPVSPDLAQYIATGYFGYSPSTCVWLVPGTWRED